MQKYTNEFPGKVSVFGRPTWTYSGVFASVGRYGIHVPRIGPKVVRSAERGPTIRINWPDSNSLINAMYFVRSSSLDYDLTGDYLGCIESEMGDPRESVKDFFPIMAFRFHMSLRQGETEFRVSGRCGNVPPWGDRPTLEVLQS